VPDAAERLVAGFPVAAWLLALGLSLRGKGLGQIRT
jgi:hypothetical protein